MLSHRLSHILSRPLPVKNRISIYNTSFNSLWNWGFSIHIPEETQKLLSGVVMTNSKSDQVSAPNNNVEDFRNTFSRDVEVLGLQIPKIWCHSLLRQLTKWVV